MKRPPSEPSSGVLVAIAIFKLLKALLLILVGFEAHRLLHMNAADTIARWVHAVRIDPNNRYLHGLISRATGLSDKRLRELSVGTFIYGGLYLVEGIGLLMRKRWAEYLTVVSTAGLMPLEVYELVKRPRMAKVVLLLANALIVVYLIVRLYRTRHRGESPAGGPARTVP